MNKRELQLLQEEVGEAVPRHTVRTKAYIDAGRWWRKTSVWICVMADELVMLAVARRRYIAKVPIADCAASHYNHATGELVIEPEEGLRFSRFPLSPRDALGVLKFLKK